MNNIFGSALIFIGLASSAFGQNLLVNGDFEDFSVPVYGDNLDVNISPWQYPDLLSTGPNSYSFRISVAKINSSVNSYTLAVPHDFSSIGFVAPTTDASQIMGQDRHVLRLYQQIPSGGGTFSQTRRLAQFFTAPYSGCIQYGISAKIPNNNGLSAVQISLFKSTDNATASFSNPNGGWASQSNLLRIGWDSTNVDSNQGWHPLTSFAAVDANNLYGFSVLPGGALLDDALVTYVDNSNCPSIPAGTPNAPTVTASTSDGSGVNSDVVSINKICEMPVGGTHNGEFGMQWNCQINVTASTTPFTGNLTVSDFQTPASSGFGNTSNQITSISSVSGNFDCSQGHSCTISGVDFDSNGEVIDVALFVTSNSFNVAINNTSFALQNCAQGQYVTSAGVSQTIAGNCVNVPWPPMLSQVAKTCDPVASVTSGPMTLNCQITVTGANLPTDGYLFLGDAFVAAQPAAASDATVTGTMTNITSNEPWACLDSVAGQSLGYCELSAADLFVAGGVSIINTSFQFDVENDPAQVVNCAIKSVTNTSVINLFAGQQNPSSLTNDSLPDICAYVDLPEGPKLVTPKVDLKKSCKEPEATTRNGVQGFNWTCHIYLDIIPTPFDGTFTLYEDASTINVGVAEFLAASVPCQGIGTDQLSCVMDGATTPASQIIQVELFTAQVDDETVIEWENCASGNLTVNGSGVLDAPKSCVETRIKPVTTIIDPAKEVFLKKSCGSPEAASHNGVNGVAWSCEITAVAQPAPFAGVFTFTEDATAVSGSNNASIIGIHPTNNAWSCSPSAPAQQTDCAISGASFNASGFETVVFDLFAQTHGDKPVVWENCVSGMYAFDGDEREITGNCETMTWKPTGTPIDPTFRIRKECKLVDTGSNAANYACSIYIDQTNADPFIGTLVVQDLFHYQGGNSTAQYITSMQGLPANWVCDTGPFTNGASCEISAPDFMANTGNRIDVQLTIPYNAFAKGEFENCAALELNGEVAANSNCVPIELPKPQKTEYDVTKTCKASGDRLQLSSTIWFQPYQCVITVTTNGVPFTDPIYVVDALTSGGNSQSANVQNITSTDPWQCIQGPYVPAGTQGVQPGCLITNADFPHSVGSSTLIVNMMMNAGNALAGTENCANLASSNGATGQLTPIASDCTTIFAAPDLTPVLDVVKTCEPAVQNGSVWNVDCTVTVTGQNLPSGEVIRVMDELSSAGANHAQSGNLSSNGGTYSQCAGGLMNNGFASSCDIFVDDLVANGGSMVFDYSGTINGPGGYALGQSAGQTTGYPQNCAYADIASAGIHGPDNAVGKSCVNIPLLMSLVPHLPNGGWTAEPATPVGPGTTGGVEECSTDVLFVVDQSSSMNQHGRLGKTRLAIQEAMNVFQGNGSAASLVTFSNQGQIVVAPAEVIPSGNMLSAVLGLSGAGQTNWADGLAKARTVVAAATEKPLVLFITDGGPNRPLGPDQWGLPPIEVAAIRAMGSRVIGIGLNQSFIESALVDVFGPNVVNVGNGDTVNPLVNDGIIIPNGFDYAEVFRQIATAYCPTFGVQKSAGTIIDLKLPEQPYLGDDEPVEEATEIQTPTPTPPTPGKPELRLVKEATDHCVVNRDTQKYDCGFRLTVTNIGQVRHTGPVAISDNFGKPTPESAKMISSGGWTCDQPRGGGMACLNRNLDLQPGQSSILDISLKIPGLRDGGRFQNCAEIGVGDNRAQRVALVQEIMNQRGLNAGPVDGQPGRKTYAALAQLQEQLGLPQAREFDDALFMALGITIGTQQSCAVAELPVMPAPPLRCDKASTIAQGDVCVCRYDNMDRRNATSCGCQRGYDLVNGRGCVKSPDPIIPQDPPKSGCQNGLPRVNGRCLTIEINPRTDDAAGADRCRIKVGGFCIK